MKELNRAKTHILTISAVVTQCFVDLSIKHSKFLGVYFAQWLSSASNLSLTLSEKPCHHLVAARFVAH